LRPQRGLVQVNNPQASFKVVFDTLRKLLTPPADAV
jgi:hypothetical protein